MASEIYARGREAVASMPRAVCRCPSKADRRCGESTNRRHQGCSESAWSYLSGNDSDALSQRKFSGLIKIRRERGCPEYGHPPVTDRKVSKNEGIFRHTGPQPRLRRGPRFGNFQIRSGHARSLHGRWPAQYSITRSSSRNRACGFPLMLLMRYRQWPTPTVSPLRDSIMD